MYGGTLIARGLRSWLQAELCEKHKVVDVGEWRWNQFVMALHWSQAVPNEAIAASRAVDHLKEPSICPHE